MLLILSQNAMTCNVQTTDVIMGNNKRVIIEEKTMTGSRCIELTDRSRKETLSENKDDFRRLKVRFYYPGEDDPNKEPIRLVEKDVLKEVNIKDPDLTCYDQRVRVYDDLKMKKGCFPLILYSQEYSKLLHT